MSSTDRKSVHIKYYAILREQRGAAAEVVETNACTAGELYDEVSRRFGFSLDAERMSVAINDQFASWKDAIHNDDVVVFVPPVAGG